MQVSSRFARLAPSVRAIAADQEASRLARQFMAVGGVSVALVFVTEGLAALSLNASATRDYLVWLTSVMTLFAALIVGALVWRLFHKALWLVRDATEQVNCLTRRGELILNSAAEAIWVVDEDGQTVFLNPAAEKITGWTLEEIQGRQQHELLRHSDSQGTPFEPGKCPVCNAIQEGITHFAADDVFWKKDGTSYPVEYHSTPLYEQGRMVGAVLTFKNISEHRMLQSKLVQAQKLESIGQLAAGIAHEINTPIQFIGDNTSFLKDAFQNFREVIAVYEQLIQEAQGGVTVELINRAQNIAAVTDISYLCAEVPKAIDQTIEGIGRVARIVRAMKDFSHPDGDTKAPADLNKAIESTTTVARNEWKYVADLKLDLDPDLPSVACLVGELNQVILNLLVNAAHAIGDVSRQNGGGKGTITISTRAEVDYAVIRVTDTGGGIPPHIRGKIFDPFFTTKPVGKGTGQGLAIAYSVIVEKHGGTIGVETEMGRGTTFIIRLPMQGNVSKVSCPEPELVGSPV
ncbi:MAG: two-component system sensor histidine kinase NtrB [Pirellulaceae bacterium]